MGDIGGVGTVPKTGTPNFDYVLLQYRRPPRILWRPWTNLAEGQHLLQPKAEGHVQTPFRVQYCGDYALLLLQH